MTFNVRAEVEALIARTMTDAEVIAFRELRAVGYANPHDIVAELKRNGKM